MQSYSRDSLSSTGDLCAVNLQLQSVQRDGGGILHNIQIDNNMSSIFEGLEVWLKGEVVVLRDYIRRQDLSTVGARAANGGISEVVVHTHSVTSSGAMPDGC